MRNFQTGDFLMQAIIKKLHPFALKNIIDRVRKCRGDPSFDFTQDGELVEPRGRPTQ